MEVVNVVDSGLGPSSYLADLGDGSALVIDPHRFPEPHERTARERGLHIAFTPAGARSFRTRSGRAVVT